MKNLSKFNLSHDNSLTCDMGELIPFCVIDCLPNDRFRLGMESFIRAQPMLAPLMHLVTLHTHYFYVPYRIIWDDWEDFITSGISGTETPEFPTIDINPTVGSLADYFGLPINNVSLTVSALPFRAYAEIYNTRYRDEDLQKELAISYASGKDTTTNTALQNCAWAKDYFTTARLSSQRGPQISIPLSSVLGGDITFQSGAADTHIIAAQRVKGSAATWKEGDILKPIVAEFGSVPPNFADYSSIMDVRDLRLASAVQRYQERSLRWGNRYEEYLQSEFGVVPRDSRIQRPEYIGGSSSVLQISEVLQTAEGQDTGVGTMRGHGVAGLSQRSFKFKSPEHGVIIGLMSIRPKSVYTQGLNRMWRKFSKFDYFTKETSTIGMQEVYQSELYANGANYDTVFGYQDKDSEYRSIPNRISGEFRGVLDYWNLSRKFDAAPSLNSDFITMKPSKRVFAETTQDSFLCMLRNKVSAYRVVPKRARNILK